MEVMIKTIAVFMVSASIGVLYRAPRALLPLAGLMGVASWTAMNLADYTTDVAVLGAFCGSFTVGMCAEILARVFKRPATIFIIPGFIPLVPGRLAYTAMVHLVQGLYAQGMALAIKTILTGGAIAFGIFVSATIWRLAANYWLEKMQGMEKMFGDH